MPGLDSPVILMLVPFAGAGAVLLFGWLHPLSRPGFTLLCLAADLILALRTLAPASPSSAQLARIEGIGQSIVLSVRDDSLSALLIVLIAIAALLAAAAAFVDLAGHAPRSAAAAALLFTLAMANGVLLAADLLTLYCFAQLASLGLLLLLLSEAQAPAQRAGLKLFVALEVPGLALLFATIQLLANGLPVDLGALPPLASLGPVALVVLGALAARSALAPVHTWFAETLGTASWSTAAFVSALAAPLAAYLLLRLGDALATPDLAWRELLLALGSLTVLLAAYHALRPRSIRHRMGALAVAQSGLLALGLATAGAAGTQAVLSQLLFTVLCLPLPFIAMGALLGNAEPVELFTLEKALARRPLAGLAFAVGLLAAAGLPPFYGFTARADLVAALLGSGGAGAMAAAGVVIVATGVFLASLAKLFWPLLKSEELRGARCLWQGSAASGAPLAAAAAVTLALAVAPMAAQQGLLAPVLGVTAGARWAIALAGMLLLAALALSAAHVASGSRRLSLDALPAPIGFRLSMALDAVDHWATTGRLDFQNIVVAVVCGIGRAAAVIFDAVLDRLAV